MTGGRRVGPYELLAEVGRGGAGVVYRARGPDGRSVAVKVLLRRDGERDARFEREARLQEMLGAEAGFVPLLDAGEERGAPYTVAPFLEGGSLRDRLRKGPLGVEETRALGERLASSIGRAHALGVVHRDLKPENVLFGADGTPLIGDLGLGKLARLDGASQSVALTRTGVLYGTTGYMPHEQMADLRGAGPPADVFALGAILFECLAGRPAFLGAGFLELAARVAAGRVDPLASLRPEVPPGLVATIERALALDPEARFPDGAALARALGGEKDGASSPRRAGVALAAGLVGVVAASAVAWHFGRAEGTPASHPPAPSPSDGTAPPSSPATSAPPTPPPRDGPPWSLGGKIRALALLPGDRRVVAGLDDGRLVLVDLETGERRSFAPDPSPVRALAVTPDGRRALSGHKEGALVCTSLESGTALWQVPDLGKDGALTLALLDDGKTFLSGGHGDTLRLGSLADGQKLGELEGHEGKRVVSIAVLPDRRVLSVGHDRKLRIRSFDARTPGLVLDSDERFTCLAIAPDGKTVYAGTEQVSRSGAVERWDLGTGARLAPIPAQREGVTGIAFARGGARLLVAGLDRKTRQRPLLLVDLEAGTTKALDLQTTAAHACVVTSDGRRAVTGDDDWLRFWDLETLAPIRGR